MAGMIGLIHVAAARLGMDDETRRDYMQKITGKRSCKGMSKRELWNVLEAMKKDGFNKTASHKGRELAADPQAKKIRALWLMMARAGVVRNRAEEALEAYVVRICGRGLADTGVKQCQAVIETLKKWAERAEDKRVAEAFAAILAGDADCAVVLEGRVIGGVQGGLQ